MENKPLVSILMNCYNGEKYLREAIDSIYNQTYKNWEIVFVDNCSIDDSAKIAKSYNDGRLKYYKTEENIPLGAARNFGLQFCKCKYLAFLDTDDIWLEEKLEKQINIMQIHQDCALCYGAVIYIDKDGKKIGTMMPVSNSGDVFSQQLKRYEINMQSVLLRNDKKMSFNEKLRHSPDFDLFMEIVSSHNAYVIKKPIVKYRKLTDSLTSKNIDVWWSEMKYTLDRLFNNSEILRNKYKYEMKFGYAKVAYYKVRYLMSLKKVKEARKELSKFKFVNMKYFILFIVSMLPLKIWECIHKVLK